MANDINDLHYYGPAPTQTDGDGILDGVLDCIVLQSNYDQHPSFDENSGKYNLRVKGPTRYLQNCYHLVGMELDAGLNSFGLQVIQRMPHPSPGARGFWKITSVNVEQIIAGEHCILSLYCESSLDNDGGGSVISAAYVKRDDATTWSCSWQSYTVKPQAFASNWDLSNRVELGSENDGAIKFKDLPREYANREWIDMFINGSDKGVISSANDDLNSAYWYRDNDGNAWYLNQPETFIAKKALAEKMALYHYPIVTENERYSVVWPEGEALSTRVPIDFPNASNPDLPDFEPVGYKMDFIVEERPYGKPNAACPFEVAPPFHWPGQPIYPSDWQWVLVDDGLQEDIRYNNDGYIMSQTWTRIRRWQGMVDPDHNFYGYTPINSERTNLSSARWTLGQL